MTLILAVTTDHGSYLAADSRGTNPRSDAAQKIFQCGPNGFIGLTGTLSQRAQTRSGTNKPMCSGELNLIEILRDFSSSYKGDGSDLPDRIKSLVYGMLAPFWELLIKPNRVPFLASRPEPGAGAFCEIPILARVGGRIELSVVRFPYSAAGELEFPVEEGPYDGAQHYRSWGVAANTDALDLKINTPQGVLETIAKIQLRTAAANEDTVGGPVDIGFLPADVNHGGRWLVRKDDSLA